MKQTTINAIRILSCEAIQKANSGHPGLPLGAAPIAYTLWQNFLKFNNKDLKWNNRDRFVLSAGHGSALNYSLLYLYGLGLRIDDLKNFRQLDSKTPGHPEYGHTPGIETSTGPLGQGIATAVGMAAAEAHLAAKFNREGFPVVDHFTYALVGDGCLEEGISYEACSFAGANELGKLIVFYDKNDITIEGNINITFKEDVAARFKAQGWQVLTVDLVQDPDNVALIAGAIRKAQREAKKPSLIICKTKIGYGSPLEGSQKCHGSPLGEENLQKTREKLGWNYPPFEVPEEVLRHTATAGRRGAKREREWKAMFAEYEKKFPALAGEYKAAMRGELYDVKNDQALFEFEKPMATRQTSEKILQRVASLVPDLVGGSADLAPSNLTAMKDTDKMKFGDFSPENYAGRNIHYGIREHAMAAIANGIALHGGLRVYCSTFFAFSDYCKNSIRMSALMDLPVLYLFTHDSIGVGEDGPTHEPVEQLIGLRSIPNLKVFRPADGKETAAAWISALTGKGPTALVLSRQNLPQYEGSGLNALKGGYVLDDCKGTPDVLLIATGSEVEPCVKAKEALEKEKIKARVISMPCLEEFEKQSEKYKESVLPSSVKARVCVEAASPYSWYKYAGEKGEIISMNGFGVSGPAPQLFEKFGFTVENIVEKAKRSLAK